ncbi:MAG TPA: FAD-binding protein [Gaiellaceae bacterium]|nr:FAD-binding protein [Gaiellaceae bacterium]
MTTILATVTGEATELSDESLEGLRAQVRGGVFTPPDPSYAQVRRPFNAMHVDRPALVARCGGTADVRTAVNFAREHGLEVTVRGGGHSIAGLSSTDGGMLIDLSPMRAVDVDPDARIARVQGGAVLGDVDHETQAFGLAAPLGAVSETGVAGLTLGGGYGWLHRKYGLACDNVLSAQVVLADGRVVTASEDVNPDLFWAIRGGGGNFGIVTSFTFRLHPVGPIVAFAGVFYALADAASVLRALRDYAQGARDEVAVEAISFSSTMPADPHLPEPVHDRQCLIVGGVYAGDAEEGMQILQPLRELGAPLADISQPMPFTVVQSAFDGFFPREQLQAYWKSLYVTELSDELVDLIAGRAQQRPAGRSAFELTYFDLLPMGGAVNRVDPAATAFSERTAPYLVSVGANWNDLGENEAQIAWVRESWSEIAARFGTGSVYLNFVGGEGGGADVGVETAHAGNLRRLAEIKAVYDPDNFFRRNNNILPAT